MWWATWDRFIPIHYHTQKLRDLCVDGYYWKMLKLLTISSYEH